MTLDIQKLHLNVGWLLQFLLANLTIMHLGERHKRKDTIVLVYINTQYALKKNISSVCGLVRLADGPEKPSHTDNLQRNLSSQSNVYRRPSVAKGVIDCIFMSKPKLVPQAGPTTEMLGAVIEMTK